MEEDIQGIFRMIGDWMLEDYLSQGWELIGPSTNEHSVHPRIFYWVRYIEEDIPHK